MTRGIVLALAAALALAGCVVAPPPVLVGPPPVAVEPYGDPYAAAPYAYGYAYPYPYAGWGGYPYRGYRPYRHGFYRPYGPWRRCYGRYC